MKIRFANKPEESRFTRRLRLLHDDLSTFAASAAIFIAINRHPAGPRLERVLNQHVAFWSSILESLQTTAVVSLARIHDQSKQSYLKPLIQTLRTRAPKESKEAADCIENAVRNHAYLIEKIRKLRDALFAHTSHEAPEIAHKGFEGLTLDMLEKYWVDMSSALARIEDAVFSSPHLPAINSKEFNNIIDEANRFIESMLSRVDGVSTSETH